MYIRGTNWNATSISYTKNYENINIQAINRVRLISLPSFKCEADLIDPSAGALILRDKKGC